MARFDLGFSARVPPGQRAVELARAVVGTQNGDALRARLPIIGSAGRSAALRRLGWGVADQGVSSLGNFAFSIVVARSLEPAQFGAFALAWVTYGVALNASRGLATDPLVVRFSGPPSSGWQRAVAAASGTALSVGLIGGLACAMIGLALPGAAGDSLVALGCFLPAILLQDSLRFAFFSSHRPALTLVNDAVWAVLEVGGVLALLLTGRLGVTSALLVFGGTAGVAAAVGCAQLRIWPRLGLVRWWLVSQRALGTRYLVENVSISGARQLRMSFLGVIAGLAAVGQVRAAEILMGPFMVLLTGISQVAVPEAVRVLARAPSKLVKFCFILGAGQASMATAWGIAMFVLVPAGLGDEALGESWPGAFAVLLPVMLNMVIGCFESGAVTGVRALGASRHSMAAQLTNASLYLTGGVAGAVWDGARGSCWGVAAATAIATLVWWRKLRRARDEYLGAPPAATNSGGTPTLSSVEEAR